ncbi:divalent metal cation transporter, partial [Streptococcus agalactiae]|nr:divalent metal cation transporter [Streptococcus agalactiae]
ILDVFLLLLLMKLGVQKIEAFVSVLILTILIIFTYLVVLSQPDLDAMFKGFLPHHELFNISHEGKNSPLTLALGIIGATVMPHNLYLHSSLSQTRRVDYH